MDERVRAFTERLTRKTTQKKYPETVPKKHREDPPRKPRTLKEELAMKSIITRGGTVNGICSVTRALLI
jgi:hypothetical protein